MGKPKVVAPEQKRASLRLKMKLTEDKKKAPPKKAVKAKKAKQAENGNSKAEEPKAEAAEAK